MPDNNEIETDSTHLEAIGSPTEIAEKEPSEPTAQAQSKDKSNWFNSIIGTISASASAVGNAAANAGSAIANTAENAVASAGNAIANTAASAGSAIANTAASSPQVRIRKYC
ncbi:MAG: hypothetical protein HC849_13005 [Oscillatoriales cyanobacterium RU_3_3]|nr:hypothetical protein [Oscillatoriales cyanobacterium RU_3_3]